jgi:hypothetical protein
MIQMSSMQTKTINLRDVPEDLVRRAKAYAALRGLSLKDFVLDAVRRALDEASPGFAPMALFARELGMKKPRRKSHKRS